MHFSIDRTVHNTAFDKPVVDHWLERKIAQTAAESTEKDRSDDRPLQRRARYRLSYRERERKRDICSKTCRGQSHWPCQRLCLRAGMSERKEEMFYLMTHSTHFIYGYMASDHG